MSLLTKMQFMLENLFNRVMRFVPSASGKILYNKWVLYFIFVVGIYDIIHFYQRGNITAVVIFFIVGFLTSFFSKNMIVVIVSAIAVSHIVAYGNKMTEGLENEKDDEEEEGFEEGIEEEEEEPKKKKETDGEAEAEAETFTENIKKMEGLLNKTEELLKESKQEGFTPIGFSEYK
jgi:hypothetical protein